MGRRNEQSGGIKKNKATRGGKGASVNRAWMGKKRACTLFPQRRKKTGEKEEKNRVQHTKTKWGEGGGGGLGGEDSLKMNEKKWQRRSR